MTQGSRIQGSKIEGSQTRPRLDCLEEIDSTNEEARRRAMAGERGPLWIMAKRQTGGRGRRGRAWSSLEGNLLATGLFVLPDSPARAAELSFAAALAAADVCDAALGDRDRTKLKWPNDALVDGKKACGVLLESGEAPAHNGLANNGRGGGLWLAVGVGINLAAHPDDVERPATDLGGALRPEQAIEILIDAFEAWRLRWRSQGFSALREAWLARAHGLGERCEARLAGETLSGVFADLSPEGALRLDLAGGGRRYISAGEVFFPGDS